jgi:transporter family-2 protein
VLAVASQAAPAGSHSRALKRSGVDRALALIGTLLVGGLVALLLLAFGDPSRLSGLHAFRPEHAIGGIAGAAIVTVSLIAVRSLGVAGVTATLVTAQLIVSVVADRVGVLGVREVGIGWQRVLGVALVIGGTYLVTRP